MSKSRRTESAGRCRLAAAIRLWLATSDLDQKRLAAAWECSESTVTRFLAGTAMPEAQTVLKIIQWSLET